MRSIIDRIFSLPTGTCIVKPGSQSFVMGRGRSQSGERTLIYSTGNSTKSLTESELIQALVQLVQQGEFRRDWFNADIHSAPQAPCGFTTIGGLLALLGTASYSRGRYLFQKL